MNKCILTLLTILLTGSLNAQSVPDPEYSSRVYYLDEDGTLKDLERGRASVDIKVKGMGYGGSEIYFTVFNAASTKAFESDGMPRMFVELQGDVDPNEVVILGRAEIKRDRRRFLQADMALGGRARDTRDAYIPLDFTRIRGELYEVEFPEGIRPGSYAFMPIGESGENISYGSKVYISCFDVRGGEQYAPNSSRGSTSRSRGRSQYGDAEDIPLVRFGLRTGLGVARLPVSAPRAVFAFEAGVDAEFKFFRDFVSGRTGLTFRKAGGSFTAGEGVHTYYLRIPAIVKGGYRFDNGMKPFLGVGPEFGLGLFGREYGSKAFGGFSSMQRFDVSWTTEFGLEINSNMGVSLVIHTGLSNVYPGITALEKNRGASFLFTYRFGKANKGEGFTNEFSRPRQQGERPAPQQPLPSSSDEPTDAEERSEPTDESIAPEPRMVDCNSCDGTGKTTTQRNIKCSHGCDNGVMICPSCEGSGNGEAIGNSFDRDAGRVVTQYAKCTKCSGEGKTTCSTCNGIGIERVEEQQACSTCSGTGQIQDQE